MSQHFSSRTDSGGHVCRSEFCKIITNKMSLLFSFSATSRTWAKRTRSSRCAVPTPLRHALSSTHTSRAWFSTQRPWTRTASSSSRSPPISYWRWSTALTNSSHWPMLEEVRFHHFYGNMHILCISKTTSTHARTKGEIAYFSTMSLFNMSFSLASQQY